VTYSIAKAAAETGLSIDTLRYYERIGLVEPPAATPAAGARTPTRTWPGCTSSPAYAPQAMPIRMMREYAQLRHRGDGTAARRRQILVEHRAEVRERINELQGCLGMLDYKITNYEHIERKWSGEDLTPAIGEAS